MEAGNQDYISITLICEERDTLKKCQFKDLKIARIQGENSFRFIELFERNISLHYFLRNCMIFLPSDDMDVMLGLYPSSEINDQKVSYDSLSQSILMIKFEKIRPIPSSESQCALPTQEQLPVHNLEYQAEENRQDNLLKCGQKISSLIESERQPIQTDEEIKEQICDNFSDYQSGNSFSSPQLQERLELKIKEEEKVCDSNEDKEINLCKVEVNDENNQSINQKRKLKQLGSQETDHQNSFLNQEPKQFSNEEGSRSRSVSFDEQELSSLSPMKARKIQQLQGEIQGNQFVESLSIHRKDQLSFNQQQIFQRSSYSQFDGQQIGEINPSANSQQNMNRQSRNKERTIKEAIEMVTKWRDLQEDYRQKHQVKGLQEVADELNISKKVLDYYFQELRTAEFFGFDFDANLGNKMGVLRKFIDERKKIHEEKNRNFKITRNLQFRYRLSDYVPQSYTSPSSPASKPISSAKQPKDKEKLSQKQLQKLLQQTQREIQNPEGEKRTTQQFQSVLSQNSPMFLQFLNNGSTDINNQALHNSPNFLSFFNNFVNNPINPSPLQDMKSENLQQRKMAFPAPEANASFDNSLLFLGLLSQQVQNANLKNAIQFANNLNVHANQKTETNNQNSSQSDDFLNNLKKIIPKTEEIDQVPPTFEFSQLGKAPQLTKSFSAAPGLSLPTPQDQRKSFTKPLKSIETKRSEE